MSFNKINHLPAQDSSAAISEASELRAAVKASLLSSTKPDLNFSCKSTKRGSREASDTRARAETASALCL